jgi:AcrR family transcriptional regulator
MSSTTRTRLLEAAERILLEQGVQALSVRKVGEVSGQNPTLITYHFGSITALLDQLCDCNLRPMQDAWQALDHGFQDKPDPLDALLTAWLEPLMAPAAFSPSGRALIVIDEIAAHAQSELSQRLVEQMTAVAGRVAQQLAPMLPDLPYDELRERLRYIAGAALGPPPRVRLPASASAAGGRARMTVSLIRFARAALTGP